MNFRRKRKLIPKIKMKKAKSSHQGKEFPMSLDNFYIKLYAEDQCDEAEQELDQTEMRTDKGDKSDDEDETKEIPEFTENEVQTAIDKEK